MNESAPLTLFDEFPKTTLGELFELLDHTSKNLKSIRRQTVKEAGLTPPQYAVLHLLWEEDKRPFKDFADALLCTRATITGIIDTLERKGFVKRMPNPADRRSVLATLTEKGHKLQHSTPSLESVYHSCCSGLTQLEVQQLGFLLSKLNESLIYEELP